MKNGFFRIKLDNPELVLGDVKQNCINIISSIKADDDSDIILMNSHATSGITMKDMLFDHALIEEINEGIINIKKETAATDKIVVFGTPLQMNSKLYDCAVVMLKGNILGVVPKENIGAEMARYYASGLYAPSSVMIDDEEVPVGTELVFSCDDNKLLSFCVVIGSDIDSKFIGQSENLVLHLGENYQMVGSHDEEKRRLSYLSKKAHITMASVNPSVLESTTDVVYSGNGFVYCDGDVIARKPSFKNKDAVILVDLEKGLRQRLQNANAVFDETVRVEFSLDQKETQLRTRDIEKIYDKMAFIPKDIFKREEALLDVINIQKTALKKRLTAINCDKAVIGISGGLDSTLAFMIIAYAFDELSIPRSNIHAVTMPCFGTSDYTYQNACRLIKLVGADFKEINISDAVKVHFEDIDHNIDNRNVAFENAQARERTQILMDMANDLGAIVVGTGDLSELALGWATYNGDHMSMYAVNGGIPKTLIREIVSYIASEEDDELSNVLLNIVETPVSPELLPPENGEISQKTEDNVGPYVLHDFFLYHMMRYGFSPAKIYKIAVSLFEGEYYASDILKWEKIFYRRFFANQYKRSCLPDGPKAVFVSVSPRGDLMMPSDSSSALWLRQLDSIE